MFSLVRSSSLCAALLTLMSAPLASAETLTGDWGGMRTQLEDAGIDVQASYTGDVLSTVSGGISKDTKYMDLLDLSATFDGEKLYGIKGSTLFIQALNIGGSLFNDPHVGSVEGVDSIEANSQTFLLYEAWVEQNFMNDTLSVRAGLYDSNTEFDVTESSGVFVNPTFGMDTAFAVTGLNGPSAFPATSLGGRIRVQPTEKLVLQMAVLDGVPGDLGDPHGTQIDLQKRDGVLVISEASYGEVASGRAGLGHWWYSHRFDHLVETDGSSNPLQRRGQGIYGFAEKTLYQPEGSDARHLDGFIRFAAGNDDVAQVDLSGSIGVSYTGPFASRPDDVAGLAWHGANNGDAYRHANPTLDQGEWGVEATYAAQILPYLTVQPDLQYIHNPGSNPDVEDAWVGITRVGVTF